jgi:hypothetical protein
MMPAIALVGAVASVSAGITALGAAATIGATLAAGASIAGGVLVGLGTVTKNPKLTKIGAVLGIAGGIGTAVSKASSASSALGGAGAEAAGDLAFAKADAAQLAGQGLGESAITQNLGTYGADTASALGQQQGFSINSVLGKSDAATAASPQMSLDPSQATRTTALAPEMSTAAAPTQALDGGAIAREAGLGIKNSTIGQSTGTFGKVMDFMRDKQNAEILKLGGGLVQGAMTSYDQQSLMKEKLRQEDAARQRYNQSILGQRMYNY